MDYYATLNAPWASADLDLIVIRTAHQTLEMMDFIAALLNMDEVQVTHGNSEILSMIQECSKDVKLTTEQEIVKRVEILFTQNVCKGIMPLVAAFVDQIHSNVQHMALKIKLNLIFLAPKELSLGIQYLWDVIKVSNHSQDSATHSVKADTMGKDLFAGPIFLSIGSIVD